MLRTVTPLSVSWAVRESTFWSRETRVVVQPNLVGNVRDRLRSSDGWLKLVVRDESPLPAFESGVREPWRGDGPPDAHGHSSGHVRKCLPLFSG